MATVSRRQRNRRDRRALRQTRPVIAAEHFALDAPDCPFLVSNEPTIDGPYTIEPRTAGPARLLAFVSTCRDGGGYFWTATFDMAERTVAVSVWPSGETMDGQYLP